MSRAAASLKTIFGLCAYAMAAGYFIVLQTNYKYIKIIPLESTKKKPVLITHDEKKIYDSENVWVIRKLGEEPIKMLIYSSMFDLIRDKGYLFFSTENIAKDFDYWNRKIFSRNDIKEMKNVKNEL